MKIKNQSVSVQTSKVLDSQGRVCEATLDDQIKTVKKMLLDRNMVVGSAKWKQTAPVVKGTLGSASLVTIELIKRGVEDGGLDSDKYGLLTATTKAFGTRNDIVNSFLNELIEERAVDQENLTELDMDDNKDYPLAEDEEAKLVSEPTEDEDTQVVEVTTKSKSKWVVDKVNYTITINGTDGNPVVIQLAPEGSWRRTALTWLKQLVTRISDGISSGLEYIGTKLSNIKESVQNSWNRNKPPYWCTTDETFKTIDTNQPCDKHGNLLTQ